MHMPVAGVAEDDRVSEEAAGRSLGIRETPAPLTSPEPAVTQAEFPARFVIVCRARSRADFIYKLGNTIEEADESALWLEILNEAELSPRSSTDSLWKEADELVRILVRSRETARANRQSRTPK